MQCVFRNYGSIFLEIVFLNVVSYWLRLYSYTERKKINFFKAELDQSELS